MAERRLGQDWINFVLGLWLFLSPLLGFGTGMEAASLNAGLLGLFIATLALFSLVRPKPWQEWVNLAFGIWLIFAPIFLDFSELGPATANHVLVGASVSLLAGWALIRRRRKRTA